MRVSVFSLLLFVMTMGCQSVDDRSAIRPLPDNAPPLSYAEMLTRTRKQTRIATEAFYVDNWIELEDAAKRHSTDCCVVAKND